MTFAPATKHGRKLRMSLAGPSGSGKTLTALRIARSLVGPEGRIAVLDTERRSTELYADETPFDALHLAPPYSPQRYMDAIAAAVSGGYDALVIDSLSHAWAGEGGAQEMVDKVTARQKAGNSWTAWAEVTPIQNMMVERIAAATEHLHLIATLRSKTEWVLETNDRGKQVPRKVGLAPIQRQNIEYEFDVFAEMDADHNLSVQKTRYRSLDGQVIRTPKGSEIADAYREWMSGSVASPPQVQITPEVLAAREALQAKRKETQVSGKDVAGYMRETHGATEPEAWTVAQINDAIAWLNLGAPSKPAPKAVAA